MDLRGYFRWPYFSYSRRWCPRHPTIATGSPSARFESSDQPGHAGELAALPPWIPSRPEPFALGSAPLPLDAIRAKWLQVKDEIAQNAIVLAGCRSVPETCPPPQGDSSPDRRCAGKGRPRSARRAQSRGQSRDRLRFGSEAARTDVGAFRSRPSPRERDARLRLAKYLALRESGIAAENLRLVVVQIRRDSATRARCRLIIPGSCSTIRLWCSCPITSAPITAVDRVRAEGIGYGRTALVDRPLAGSM